MPRALAPRAYAHALSVSAELATCAEGRVDETAVLAAVARKARVLNVPAMPYHVTDHAAACWLIRGATWRRAKNLAPWVVQAAFVCVATETDAWLIERVPAKIQTIGHALEWLKPQAVKKALAEQMTVRRVGRCFFVAAERGPSNFRAALAEGFVILQNNDSVVAHAPGGAEEALEGARYWRAHAMPHLPRRAH
jgi:hypothetical protein